MQRFCAWNLIPGRGSTCANKLWRRHGSSASRTPATIAWMKDEREQETNMNQHHSRGLRRSVFWSRRHHSAFHESLMSKLYLVARGPNSARHLRPFSCKRPDKMTKSRGILALSTAFSDFLQQWADTDTCMRGWNSSRCFNECSPL